MHARLIKFFFLRNTRCISRVRIEAVCMKRAFGADSPSVSKGRSVKVTRVANADPKRLMLQMRKKRHLMGGGKN